MITRAALPQSGRQIQTPWAYFSLCPFSQIAIRVMKLVNREETPLSQISELVSSDPAFATEVLKAANSLWYIGFAPVDSIFQAVTRIGAKNLQGICLTVAVRAFLGDSMSRPVMRDMWRHNLACAFIAENFALAGAMDAPVAYTGGVLHDLGRLALAVLKPKEYVFLLGKHNGPSSSILEQERAAFGYDHCQVGQELIASWKLPLAFEAMVAQHHAPRTAEDPWDMPALINLSCRMADSIGFPAFQGVECAPFDDLLLELPERHPDSLRPTLASLTSDIQAKIDAVEAI